MSAEYAPSEREADRRRSQSDVQTNNETINEYRNLPFDYCANRELLIDDRQCRPERERERVPMTAIERRFIIDDDDESEEVHERYSRCAALAPVYLTLVSTSRCAWVANDINVTRRHAKKNGNECNDPFSSPT